MKVGDLVRVNMKAHNSLWEGQLGLIVKEVRLGLGGGFIYKVRLPDGTLCKYLEDSLEMINESR